MSPLVLAQRELARRELARRSLLDFIVATKPGYEVGWVHREVTDLLDAFIEAVEKRLSPRLIIELPPRHGKSEIVSRRFPAYILGKHPEWEVVCATYNQDLADDLGRDVRALIHEPLYSDLFPGTVLRKDSNSVSYMKTVQGGSYTTVGIGGALTGRGLHVGIIDDPVKNRADADSELIREATWKWYQSVFRTRAAPGAGLILLQTRWHEDDLAGKIQLQMQTNADGDKWHLYSFPAIALKDEPRRKEGEALHPARYCVEELLTLKNTIDAREWSALFQQNPVPLEGIHFKREWMHWERPPKDAKLNWYITTDFAIGEKSTNDYTVLWPFAVDDADDVYFAPPVRGRWPAGDIIEKLCDLCDTYKPVQIALENVHISKTFGPFLKKRMQERRIYTTLWDFTQTRDKVARSASFRGRMQQGKVFLDPTGRPEVEPEFLAFPAGRHDDLVDAGSCGMLMMDTLLTAPGPPPPPKEGPPPWSMDWIRARVDDSAKEKKVYRPAHLNGRARALPKSRSKSWTE